MDYCLTIIIGCCSLFFTKQSCTHVLQTMLKQIEWFITEHFKHPPPIGTRVWMVDSMSDEKNGFYGTVLCHIQGGKQEQN